MHSETCKPRQRVTVTEKRDCAVKDKVSLTAAPGDMPPWAEGALTWWSCWVGSPLGKSQSFGPLSGRGGKSWDISHPKTLVLPSRCCREPGNHEISGMSCLPRLCST